MTRLILLQALDDPGELLGESTVFGSALFYLLFVGLMVAGMWKAFRKAGYEGWEAIVPVYNLFILNKIAGRPSWWPWVIMIAPLIGVVSTSVVSVRDDSTPGMIILTIYFFAALATIFYLARIYKSISHRFGYGILFAAGLLFLGFIFWPLLGFGDAQYKPLSNLQDEIDNVGSEVRNI